MTDHADHRGRITVDLDAKDYSRNQFRLRATRAYSQLADDADEVEVHVSSSGLGLHLVAWFEDPLEFHEEIALRRQHGDDPRRVDMDIKRWFQGLYTGVLFEEKGDKEKERRFSGIFDALDWIDAQRDDANRVKRLANDGHKGAPDLVARANL